MSTQEDHRGAAAAVRHGWAALLAIGAAVQLAAFWPGVMVWDAIRQYREALAGRYDDWHPPAMDWLWRQLAPFGDGPAPMLAVQALLYWSGFALLARAQARAGRPRAAWAIAACALLPVPYLLVGTVLKDSLMAGALLLAAGLLADAGRGRRAAAAALLLAAAALRFNAVPACLPLLALAAPPRWRATPVRLALVLAAGAVLLAAALPLANRLLGAERSGVEQSLIVYDLGGVTRFSGTDAFPPVGVADPVAVNARCWSPVSWDSYAWWVAAPCPIGFEGVRAALAARGEAPLRWWAAAVLRHPLAYAQHRLAHANRNLRLWTRDADLPGLSLQSDPNPWHYAVPERRLRGWIDRVAVASLATPFGWPVVWLALAAACLLVRPRGDGLGVPLAWSALLYAASYGPLSVASEVRYHFWTITAAAVAAVLTLAARPRPPRWRVGAAALLLAGTVLVATLGRWLA